MESLDSIKDKSAREAAAKRAAAVSIRKFEATRRKINVAKTRPAGAETRITSMLEAAVSKHGIKGEGKEKSMIEGKISRLLSDFKTLTQERTVSPEIVTSILDKISDLKGAELKNSRLNQDKLLADETTRGDIENALNEYVDNLQAEKEVFRAGVDTGISEEVAAIEAEKEINLHIVALYNKLDDIMSEGINRLKLEKAINKEPFIA